MTAKDLMVIKKETADIVLSKVQQFQKNGELDLPPNYSAANALKSAWLVLQETVDRNKKPALEVCTKASIANALLDMVVQGLNPAKLQAYFIVRGNKLCMDRSYFGTKAVCLRVNKDLDDIYAEVVYAGDELEYNIVRGRRIIERHKQKFTNIDDSKIVAAYAVAVDKEGEVVRSELMTLPQLKQAWKQSPMNPVMDNGELNPKSAHAKFTGEMAKKSVTSRLAKHIINSSSDADLVIASVKRTDEQSVEAEAEAEVDEFSNSEVIDIERANGDHQPNESELDPGEMSDEEKAEIMAQEAAEASEGPGF
ncbi:MAG TPA: RecT family recombinase [Desulfobacterales bacterium]|nr:RecT family recombinase [Desulfobacterales bacterium]